MARKTKTSLDPNIQMTDEDFIAEIFVHELLHSWYSIINREGNLWLRDQVHEYSGIYGPVDRNFGYIVNKLKPHWHYLYTSKANEPIIMTEEEVRLQYALAFYREPDEGELEYWTGKPLVDFLKTAVSDRAVFLAQQA